MKWINVKKTLPINSEVVLTCSVQWGVATSYYDGVKWRDSQFNDTYGYAVLEEEITHWMPYPNPPYTPTYKVSAK